MKLRRAVTALCAALCGASVQCEPVAYALDPERSAVHFELLHFGTSTLRGRFGPVAGVVTLDRAVGSGEVNLRLATATVNTAAPNVDGAGRNVAATAGWEAVDIFVTADVSGTATLTKSSTGRA